LIVVLSDAAEAELEAFGDWIAKDSPLRAVSYVRELRDACEQLGDMSRASPLLPHRPESGIRRRPYGNYLIFYAVDESVSVIHLLHGARNYDAILFPE
jgi:plasmid stabilization system protein ParE